MRRRSLLHGGFAAAVSAGLAGLPGAAGAQISDSGEHTVVYGDGTARINELLNAGLNVGIPAGTYIITGELEVRDGHVVSSAPGARVILKTAAAYGGRIVATHDKSFTLRGLIFDGSYQERLHLEGSADAPLIQVVGGSNVTLENNHFLHAPSFAVWTWRSALLQVRGNNFLECYQPIRMDGANLSSGSIEGNTFTNTAAFRSIQHIDALHTVNLTVRGNVIIVKHNASAQTLYAHLSRIDVRLGQKVNIGDRIGAVGATGWATGPHLHFEFRVDGAQQDPVQMAKHSASVPLSASARPEFERLARSMGAQLAAAGSTTAVARAN